MSEPLQQHLQHLECSLEERLFGRPHISEIAGITAHLPRSSSNTARLAELAVAWVLANPTPAKLEPPPYRR